ncbi:hypothetical protein BDR26DRAFT_915429 [Obelidium mucronatum]|nr:hypothetical protein BDR26DRAFT_915429 [Obelidium mucronatum]
MNSFESKHIPMNNLFGACDAAIQNNGTSIFDFLDPLLFDIMAPPSLHSYTSSAATSISSTADVDLLDPMFMTTMHSSWSFPDPFLASSATALTAVSTSSEPLQTPGIEPKSIPLSIVTAEPVQLRSLSPITKEGDSGFFGAIQIPTDLNLHSGARMLENSRRPESTFLPPAALTLSTISPLMTIPQVKQEQRATPPPSAIDSPISCDPKNDLKSRKEARRNSTAAFSPLSCPSSPSLKGRGESHKNRSRFRFQSTQQSDMIARFETDPYPSNETMAEYAAEFGTTFHKIKIWYQNRRSAEKRRAVGGK